MIAIVLDTTDLSELATELAGAGLPTSDLDEPDRHFFRFEDDAGIAGYGGIEGNGPDRLLRSLVVRPDRRGGGWALPSSGGSSTRRLIRASLPSIC